MGNYHPNLDLHLRVQIDIAEVENSIHIKLSKYFCFETTKIGVSELGPNYVMRKTISSDKSFHHHPLFNSTYMVFNLNSGDVACYGEFTNSILSIPFT